jgi:hypothetical protein
MVNLAVFIGTITHMCTCDSFSFVSPQIFSRLAAQSDYIYPQIIFHHTTIFLAICGLKIVFLALGPQSQLIVYSLKIHVYLNTQSAD